MIPASIDVVAKNYIAKGLIAVAPSNVVPGACDAFCSGTLNAQGSNIDDFNEFTARLDYNMSEQGSFQWHSRRQALQSVQAAAGRRARISHHHRSAQLFLKPDVHAFVQPDAF